MLSFLIRSIPSTICCILIGTYYIINEFHTSYAICYDQDCEFNAIELLTYIYITF